MRTVLAILLVLGVIFTTGCGSREIKPVETDCGPCAGGSCKIPQDVAQKTQRGGKNTGSSMTGFTSIPSADQLVAGEESASAGQNKSKSDVALVKKFWQSREENSALSGEAGNFNDVKLPGVAHRDYPQEQSFVARTFKPNIWPGGVQLEAEVDPQILNF